MFLPELLPEVERVLYLDADLIVQESVAPLWDIDVSESFLAAVSNVLEPRYADRPRALGIPDSQGYFNAGVLLLNLDLMRRDGSSQALQEYARRRADDLLWRDQDALNVVLGPRRVSLHPRWNCINSIAEFGWGEDVFGAEALAQARASPAIRHFEGPGFNKPWHYLAPRKSRELYRRHRRATPWPRVRPRAEGRGTCGGAFELVPAVVVGSSTPRPCQTGDGPGAGRGGRGAFRPSWAKRRYPNLER